MFIFDPVKTILIADRDGPFCEKVSKNLSRNQLKVFIAHTGYEAQEILNKENIDLILSGIRMPKGTGLQLLKYCRQNFSEIPFIIMTGFHEAVEISEAHKIGASSFLAKPFDHDVLVQEINKQINKEINDDKSKEDDERFFAINISEFISGSTIKYPIYLQLADNRYVMLGHTGEDLSRDRINEYRDKGLKKLYLKGKDFRDYIEYNRNISVKIVEHAKGHTDTKIKLLKHTSEIIMNYCFKNQMTEEIVEAAEENIMTTLDLISSDPHTAKLLSKFGSLENPLYAHSVEVALVAGLIAKKKGWVLSKTYLYLTVAGLFHDIGKRDMDFKIYSTPQDQLSAQEVKELHEHPKKGAEILRKIKDIPPQVIELVEQHHENPDGSGYPEGLSRGKLHPLGTILSMANEFCNLTMPGPYAKHTHMSAQDAINKMESQRKFGSFDPESFQALSEIFVSRK